MRGAGYPKKVKVADLRQWIAWADRRIGALVTGEGLHAGVAQVVQGPMTVTWRVRLLQPTPAHVRKMLGLGPALKQALQFAAWYARRERVQTEQKAFVGKRWRDFLLELGAVGRFDVVRVVDDFILPKLEAESCQDGQWFVLIDFIRRHIQDYESGRKRIEDGKATRLRRDPLEDLKQRLRIASADVRGSSAILRKANELYLSRDYLRDCDVAIAFGDLLSNHYVSGDYLRRSAEGSTDEERKGLVQSWRDFLDKVGVLRHVPMAQRRDIEAYRYSGWDTEWIPESGRKTKVTDKWNDLIEQLL